jgi:hypothetical protein
MSLINKEPIIKVGIIADREINFTLNGEYKFNGKVIEKGDYCVKIEKNKIKTSFGESSTSLNLTPLNKKRLSLFTKY